jgi:DNA-binding transcriptional ArsR family regulator
MFVMDSMLRALADGTRRQILALVWRQERTAGEIAAQFTMSRPAISQHLAILQESELVTVRRESTRRFYRANRRAVARLRAELGTFWERHLRQLKDAAEAADRKHGQ